MAQKPKLLDRVRNALRIRNYAYRTEKSYVQWVKRFILYHDKRHPAEMGKAEIEDFLRHLAVDRRVAASTQNQALSAILFLYREVLEQPIEWVDVPWAKKPKRLPVALSREEVNAVLEHLSGVPLLIVQSLYGSGLRLTECLRLRVKDVDFGQKLLVVRVCDLWRHSLYLYGRRENPPFSRSAGMGRQALFASDLLSPAR